MEIRKKYYLKGRHFNGNLIGGIGGVFVSI